MVLGGDVTAVDAPGQFINIRLAGHFLRRPVSVNDISSETVTIIYKVLGHGTEEMTHLVPGDQLDVLTGLGNGYDLACCGSHPLLIGGGVGIPPLYLAARLMLAGGSDVTAILGYNSTEEIYYAEEFEKLGCRVIVATADGSTGIRGLVTDAFAELTSVRPSSDSNDGQGGTGHFTYFYSCGPQPMLRAVYEDVYKTAGIPGQMSFEERMGCGFGACMGCSCRTVTGYKRICKDGPVLRTEEILW